MKFSGLAIFSAVALASHAALTYDAKLAAQFDGYVAPMTQDGLTAGGIPPAKFLEALKSGKKITVLDIRTPNEAAIYGITHPTEYPVHSDDRRVQTGQPAQTADGRHGRGGLHQRRPLAHGARHAAKHRFQEHQVPAPRHQGPG
ncbi:MAG: hypothetical protein LT080_15265 [Thiobacillus sp.]|nr:hypothetical protein [Thiobacillus sp.]